jgi:predicted DNA-binding ribbon-helix-helix protein
MKSPGLDTSIRKRSVEIAGHRTSVSIEQPFWQALKDLADQDGLSVNALIAKIDGTRQHNLSSAIRVYVLKRLQAGGGERAPGT